MEKEKEKGKGWKEMKGKIGEGRNWEKRGRGIGGRRSLRLRRAGTKKSEKKGGQKGRGKELEKMV